MTTQNININTKGQLAKLIATENLEVRHNKVKTASFDTKNRILTLPIFKVQSGDVYDMLIAHECSHALWTPTDGWKSISDDPELRSYCNVLEDTRIDKLIQSKYPGVVINYMNGFDILNKQNFFSLMGKDVDTDLMLIDKINMRSKSLNRINFNFSKEEKSWIQKVDNIKTFDDVVTLAKEMLDWQKKQIEELKKLPDFDNHPIVENYDLSDEEEDGDNDNKDEGQNQQDSNGENDLEESDENESTQSGSSQSDDKSDDEDKKEQDQLSNSAKKTPESSADSGKFGSITNMSYEENQSKLHDGDKEYIYANVPDVSLSDTIVSYKTFLQDFRKHIISQTKPGSWSDDHRKYLNFLKQDFKSFKKDNQKTVNYLVKEFEMKKAATAYKRSSQDKTGVLDPLKLKNYKFSDDIFKRLTITPDAKNHGMIMLLDWSGSMCDVIKKTVDQLINLVYFCQKVNIPFEVYFFTSEYYKGGDRWSNIENEKKVFSKKEGDLAVDQAHCVNIASHRMNKRELDESMMYMYSSGLYYERNYSRRRRYEDWESRYENGQNFGMPNKYSLGNTPLNEALIMMLDIVPKFKKKYNIEKMNFMTLTDGGANGYHGVYSDVEGKMERSGYSGQMILKHGKKSYTLPDDVFSYSGQRLTSLLLTILKSKYGVVNLGFYILKNVRSYEAERYFGNKWSDREKYEKNKKDWLKNNVACVEQSGYDQYFVMNGKKMEVETTDISEITNDMKAGRIRQLFSKSMKGRITSRVLLNKFIERVA